MPDNKNVDLSHILSQALMAYRNLFAKYRDEFGQLDSDKWFKDFEVDYILEILLANINYTTFLCEYIIERENENSNGSEDDTMPDYDLGYLIASDCSSVIEFALHDPGYVRESLTTELFYSFVQYFNISNSANRIGWLDVNKRLAAALSSLAIFNPELSNILDVWAENVDHLDETDLEDGTQPRQLIWKHNFISQIREFIGSN